MVTKSGTNRIHGDLFEFVRNGDLNAKNYFAPTHDTLKRDQYGVAVGGPILKNKLFYFGTYQGTRVRSSARATWPLFLPLLSGGGGKCAVEVHDKGPLGSEWAVREEGAALMLRHLLPSARR